MMCYFYLFIVQFFTWSHSFKGILHKAFVDNFGNFFLKDFRSMASFDLSNDRCTPNTSCLFYFCGNLLHIPNLYRDLPLPLRSRVDSSVICLSVLWTLRFILLVTYRLRLIAHVSGSTRGIKFHLVPVSCL